MVVDEKEISDALDKKIKEIERNRKFDEKCKDDECFKTETNNKFKKIDDILIFETCPNCNYNRLLKGSNICPNCHKELEW